MDDREQIETLLKDGYDVAQICRNGHVSNKYFTTDVSNNQNYCERCGAQTVIKCERCRMFIRGANVYSGDPNYAAPRFCRFCGESYPWTASRLKAAKDLAEELEDLNDDEKALLKQSIDDIVRDSPETTVAASRFKRLVVKGGKEMAGAFRDILVDVASETAKKLLWP